MKSTETILAEIQKDIKHIRENQEKDLKDLDERLSKEDEKVEVLDVRLQKVEVKQAIVVTKLAMLISGAVFGLYFAIERIWDFIFKG